MFLAFLEKHQIQNKILAVAVSGGADSLGLILMADEELRPLGYRLVALTVNHGLRPTAAKEAAYVSKIMKAKRIEHHTLVWRGKKPITGVEEAARTARYELLSNWCESHHIGVLFLAHHLYDQAETFLMRLQRGSGLDGLCAMNECTQRNGLRLLRPLLTTPPQVMKDYLTKQNIHWIEDESNKDERLLRVKIRQVLPVLEKLGISAEKIGKTCKRLQISKTCLQIKAQELLASKFVAYGDFALKCEQADFLDFEPEMQYRLLTRVLQTVGKNFYTPRAESVLSLLERFKLSTFKTATLAQCKITLLENCLWFLPEKAPLLGSRQKEWKTFLQKNPKYKNQKIPSAVRAYLARKH